MGNNELIKNHWNYHNLFFVKIILDHHITKDELIYKIISDVEHMKFLNGKQLHRHNSDFTRKHSREKDLFSFQLILEDMELYEHVIRNILDDIKKVGFKDKDFIKA